MIILHMDCVLNDICRGREKEDYFYDHENNNPTIWIQGIKVIFCLVSIRVYISEIES